MGQAQTTTDHDVTWQWTKERDGGSSKVTGTEGNDGEGISLVAFAEADDWLTVVDREECFQTIEQRCLAFLHQDETADGKPSRFFNFIPHHG